MGYNPRTTARDHQRAAIAASRKKPRTPVPTDVFAYLMDMGTGKSKVILDEHGQDAQNGGPQDMLLFAPAGSYRNWFADKGEDPEYWCELRKHLDPDMLNRAIIHGWRGGKTVGEKRELEKFLATRDKKRPRFLFVNIEGLSSVERLRDLCREFLSQRESRVVGDESTSIKNPSSDRTKFCWELGDMEKVVSKRILSGLWTPKSPLDLFAQCYFLDPRILGQRNFFVFRRKYAQLVQRTSGGRKFWQVVGYQNIEDLQKRVAPYSFRVLKKDCTDLEPKTYTTREVELTTEQKKLIKELRLNGFSEFKEGKFVTVDMVVKRIARETQIACGYVMDDEERILHEVPENRTDVLMEVLAEHRGKAIIWCPWRPPLEKIVQRITKEYGPEAVAQWHGGNKKSRPDEERRFLNDPACRFMCATQGAGMRGNTWTNADLTVYYANNYNLEERDQSEDRNHRIGQVNPVTYVDLIAPGCNDEKVVKNLRQKMDLATMINREGYREWVI